MSAPYSIKSFPVKTQNIYSAIYAGTALFNNPALIANCNTVESAITAALPDIAALNTATTDYTVSLSSALVAANTSFITAINALSTHITHQISSAPILFTQCISAESIKRTVNTSIGADDIMLALTALLRGTFNTTITPVTTALAVVTSKIAVINNVSSTGAQITAASIIAASITALTSAITTVTAVINNQVNAEIAIENDILNVLLSFGTANALVGISTDTGFVAVKAAAGTSALNTLLS